MQRIPRIPSSVPTPRPLSGRAIELSARTRYAVAIGAAVAAILLRLGLDPEWGVKLPYITLFPAIMLSAWLGGLWPGLVTTIITAAAAEYFWIDPVHSWAVTDRSELLGLAVFVAVGAVISTLNEAWRRGTHAVIESEDRLRVTLASIGDAVITTDDEGRVTHVNAIAEALTGWSQREALGQPLSEIFVLINEQTRESGESPVYRALREGVIHALANHTLLVAKNRREIPIDDSAAPIRTADGRIIGAVMVFRDITERRRAERERATLLETERTARAEAVHVANELRQLQTITDTALSALDRDPLIRELLGRVRTVLRCDTATMLLLDPTGTYLTPVASDGVEQETDSDIRVPIGKGFAGRIAASNTALIVDDVASADIVNPVLRSRLKSVIGVPLKIGQSLLGVMHAGSTSLRQFSHADAALLSLAADRIAVALERARLHEMERTARRQVETAIEQLQIALASGRMGTWEYALHTGAIKWSPALEAIHGLVPGSFPGTFEAFRNEIHPEDRDRVLNAIRQAVDQGRDHHVEYRIVRADGNVRWVEGRGRLFLDDARQPDRMIGVCSDITERKADEEERTQVLAREQAAHAELDRASRLKDEFLAVLSHELRTPLNAVLGYAQLLATGALPAERTAHALNAIQRNAQAQSRLVESLLDLSRTIAGKLELNLEELDISTVLAAALDVIRPEADAKGITIDYVPPSDAVMLVGDAGRLQQVFWNLLVNAIKFTPRGGRIIASLATRNGNAEVQVTDNGQGIRSDFLPHVFDRFSQADSRNSQTRIGLGLGLALVREMVHAHGGSVVAASPGDGRGSTFTVNLPLAMLTAREAIARETASHLATGEPLSHVRILVVDDDVDARDAMALLLESRGATVVTASSATEALAAIGERRFDVLLADLQMPEEDGRSLIRKLRVQERERGTLRLPAIAATAYASVLDGEEAIAAGYDGHVAKPIDPDLLARTIMQIAKLEKV